MGYFGIGIISGKSEDNTGMLWRSAEAMGAQFIFTIGARYPKRQRTDTFNTTKQIPLFEYTDFADFGAHIPRGCELIAVEIATEAKTLAMFNHPERAVYLLGAEDFGIDKEVLAQCSRIVSIPSTQCLNVAVTGSILMYDRLIKI